MSMAGFSSASASGFPMKTLDFSCDYVFLPQGERALKNIFDQRMRSEGIFAKIEYKRSTQVFVITCTERDSEEVLMIVHGLYTDLIHKEVGDVYEELKSNLIAKPLNPAELDVRVKVDLSVSTQTEDLISFDIKSSWHCNTPDFGIGSIVPKRLQLNIEEMTGTQLVEDLNSQVIHVHGQSQEHCDRAIYKLDIIYKYHYLAKQHFSHHLFTEEYDHYEIGIGSLPEIRTKLERTTLLDPVYTSYNSAELGKAYIIQCFRFESIRNRFILKKAEEPIPATSKKDKGKAFELWSLYHFPGMGDESMKHRHERVPKPMPVEPLRKVDTVQKWLATGISHDQDEVMEQMRLDMQRAEEIKISSSASYEIEDSKGFRPSKRLSMHRSPSMQDLSSGNMSRPNDIRHTHVIHSLLDIDIQDIEKQKLKGIEFSANSALVPNLGTDNIMDSVNLEIFMSPHTSQSLSGNLKPKTNGHGFQSASTGEALWLGGDPTPDSFLTIIQEEKEIKSNSFDKNPVTSPRRGLVSFADLDVHRLSDNFRTDMEDNAYTVLTRIRNYQGEVKMKCFLGRLFLKPFKQSIMDDLKKLQSIPASKARELLQGSPKKVKFTKIITTLPADINFLLEMKITEKNQQIWGEAEEWTVTFEYVCCDSPEHLGGCVAKCIIEMDADSLETTVRTAEDTFGDLHVHCTLRSWDYMVSFRGSQDLEEDYGDLANAIKDSTYLATGSKEVYMSFELNHRLIVHFLSIRVRRHSQYRSYDGKTLLNITEVQNLHVDWDQGEESTTFFVRPSKEPNSIWYEVNLESVEAKTAFKDNLDLDLGEEAEWDPELLVQGGVVVNDLCLPANYIIRKMDGVGFYNNNGNQLLAAEVESNAAKKIESEQQSDYQYW